MSTSDGRPAEVTTTATRVADPSRWVRLTVGLREAGHELTEVLTHAVPFACEIEARDEPAAGYDLENWESGLLSGYFFVCRRARRMPPPPVRVYELSGSLGAEDMSGVVRAAEVATAHLFGFAHPTDEREWRVSVATSVPAPAMG